MKIFEPQRIRRTLVVGSGVMGHAIAQVFAQGGIEVDLIDRDEKALRRAMALIASNLQTLAEFGRIPTAKIPQIIARVHPSLDLVGGAKRADFVVEAVNEVREVKQEVFSQLDAHCGSNTIIASNTSSLDIFKIADIKGRERLIAAHWFTPAHIIPLVEVAAGPDTSPVVVNATVALLRRLGKMPIVLRRFIPSFIVNRIQNAIARAVWEMLDNGWATLEEIDFAVKETLGIRLPVVGVVQSLDFAGLDVVADIMKGYGVLPRVLADKIRRGHLGAKTSKGFYDYNDRQEEEIVKKRDRRYLQLLSHLEAIGAFEPI